MNTDAFFISRSDGAQIAVHRWIPTRAPKFILQISHGMAEFARRYDHFAELANKEGFVVYADDHRGHGETAKTLDAAGYLADSDGFNKVVEDVRAVTLKAQEDYPGIPVVLFAHSFGSFIGQRYIQLYGDKIAACVLSGSKGPDPFMVAPARLLANLIALFKGKKYRSNLLHNLAFGSYNKRIPHAKSENSWLSRDDLEVEKYDASPWCGFICTVGFYCDLMDGLTLVHSKKAFSLLPKQLPVLLTGGSDDPVSAYGKTLEKLAQIYAKQGMTDVTLRLYDGGRHEMVNETNKDEFMQDVLSWIKEKLK